MINHKFVSILASDVQMIIVHNPIHHKGDVSEEEHDRLFGNIHQVWQPLMDCLNAKTQERCHEALQNLHVDFEGTKGATLQFFAKIAEEPRRFLRADLV